MKYLLIILSVLTLAVITPVILYYPGFVVIGGSAWSIESSLAIFIIIFLLTFIFLYVIMRILLWLWNLPKYLKNKRNRLQQAKMQQSLLRGFAALIEEQWQHAEQLFSKNNPQFINYLGAAYAAQKALEINQRDKHLNAAQLCVPKEHVFMVNLFQIQLQLEQQQFMDALGNLLELYETHPKNKKILKLLMFAYTETQNWTKLYELLPKLSKYKIISKEKFNDFENKIVINLLSQAMEQDINTLNIVWEKLPKTVRLRTDIVKVYVKYLLKSKQNIETAEQLLREALKQQWDTELVKLYAKLESNDISKQLNYAEHWMKAHRDDAMLLMCLGVLCKRNKLWGKAQQYLETSIAKEENPYTYQILGELLTQTGNTEQATIYYLKGLQMVNNYH
jgi:HemY protein